MYSADSFVNRVSCGVPLIVSSAMAHYAPRRRPRSSCAFVGREVATRPDEIVEMRQVIDVFARGRTVPAAAGDDIVGDDATVLVVGGSLNGLSAALLLAHRGEPGIVVERHPGTSIQYKFRGISPRTLG